MRKISICFLIVSLQHVALAQLRWEKTEVDVPYVVSSKEVVVEFNFINEGKDIVQIEKLEPCCGCVFPVTDRNNYAPGEKGKLTATFTIGDSFGKQIKRVRVTAGGKTQVLNFSVLLPEWVHLSDNKVRWELGGDGAAKRIIISAPSKATLEVIGVKSACGFVKPEFRTVHEGEMYELVLKPIGTRLPIVDVIRIQIRLENNVQREASIIAIVEKMTEKSAR